jgi:hypothetical protein
VWDLIAGKAGARNPHEYYAFSTGSSLEALISGDGRWKLHLPHEYRTVAHAGSDGVPGEYRVADLELSLFDMENDPHETTNVLGEHPEVAAKLREYAERHREAFYATEAPR